jgi:hypothetical protein
MRYIAKPVRHDVDVTSACNLILFFGLLRICCENPNCQIYLYFRANNWAALVQRIKLEAKAAKFYVALWLSVLFCDAHYLLVL